MAETGHVRIRKTMSELGVRVRKTMSDFRESLYDDELNLELLETQVKQAEFALADIRKEIQDKKDNG